MERAGSIIFLRLSVLLLCLMCAAACHAHTTSVHREAKILHLNSYHPSFPTSSKILAGLEDGLGDLSSQIDVEYMDSKKRYDDTSQSLFLQMLAYKLSHSGNYDVVVTSDDNALRFALKHRQQLFPETPIVFLGVNDIDLALTMNNNDWVTGLVEAVSIDETIDLMSTLFPSASTMTAIVDNTTSGRSDLVSLMRSSAKLKFKQINTIDIGQHSWDEIPAMLTSIDQDQPVLLLSAYVDKNLHSLSFNDSLGLLNRYLQAPIFHLWEHGLDGGIIGGSIISHTEQGRQAGLLVRKIISGQTVNSLPVLQKSPNVLALDHGELIRHKVPNGRVPENAVLHNKVPSFLDRYATHVASVTVLILLLAAVIVFLAVQVRIRIRLSHSLRKSESIMRTVVDNLSANIYMKDTKHRYVFVNKFLSDRYADAQDSMLGRPVSEFLNQDLAAEVKRRDDRVFQNGEKFMDEMVLPVDNDKGFQYLETTRVPLINDKNEVYGLCGIDLDVTAQKEYEQELRSLAHYDPLTGLSNRVLFLEQLEQQMERVVSTNEQLVLMYLDLDHFKLINDTFGHDMGDSFLCFIADTLKREFDTDTLLARFGGDEFLVALPQNILHSAKAPSKSILQALSHETQINGVTLSTTASIGITVYPQDNAVTPEHLIRQADQAMYVAKKRSGNYAFRFDALRDKSESERERMIDKLHQALEKQEFQLYYQPKVDLYTGKPFAVEALIRWQHPEHGTLTPGAFLPYIEQHQLIEYIDHWVLNEALKQCAEWQSLGIDLPVSINISDRAFNQSDFISTVENTLSCYPNLPKGALDIEVLETVEMNNIDEACETIKALQAIGVTFSLDDFGTGFSSLTYLKNLPIETLKVDQSFVFNMMSNLSDRKILQGIIAIAHSFDIRALAEGIETAEQGAYLKALGYRYGQGYAIAKPMPANTIVEWLEGWTPPQEWQDAIPAPMPQVPELTP